MYISLKHVTKRYDDKVVLNDISLEIEKGQILALLGPSGCGKTTLLNSLAGLVDIESGQIEVNGQLYSSGGYTLPPESRKIGMVFQDFALWPHMNVFDNIAFGLKVQRLSRSAVSNRVAEMLEVVRLSGYENHFPYQLSGGQKQRVAIARALASGPSLLLMDEPLSSLDAQLRVEMRWQLVEIIRRAGVTTVYVTHDQAEALTMADHIVLLHRGNIEQQGTPTDLYRSPETSFTAAFIGASNLLPCDIVSESGEFITVDCDGLQWMTQTVDYVSDQPMMLMVRPDHIQEIGQKPIHSKGTSILGKIERKSYLGNQWLYGVRISCATNPVLEWLDDEERQLGDSVSLWIPMEATRIVRKDSVALV
ncbi:ABC transporter ATP-binding protein [Alicyclobacillus fastidiosus]|uniref:ABC transporter ATP-binding protein n=1 Tax=Alicyclobacillus fastidiosus TaxID=392011 RepID=UPI0023E9311E|nr:ABC transporter ATP-binding protein [Alicyclobacillus fastidiosus]GMA65983.1 spermidine/putrescine import ATP-binding protein PotA [Alicyclobacillus fastidiosus]